MNEFAHAADCIRLANRIERLQKTSKFLLGSAYRERMVLYQQFILAYKAKHSCDNDLVALTGLLAELQASGHTEEDFKYMVIHFSAAYAELTNI
jgi:hypothetical protein